LSASLAETILGLSAKSLFKHFGSSIHFPELCPKLSHEGRFPPFKPPIFFTAVKAVVKSKPDLDGGGGKNVYFLHSQTKSSGDTLLSKFSTKLFPPSFV
jgi:hypothetical protein